MENRFQTQEQTYQPQQRSPHTPTSSFSKATHPESERVGDAEAGHVLLPQRCEVDRQADLAASVESVGHKRQSLSIDNVRVCRASRRTHRYILDVLPSSSGMHSSGFDTGYVAGI